MAGRERRIGSLGENDSGVLLPLYEGELNDLQRDIGPNLSKTNEIVFLHAALQLRSYYLLERSPKTALKEGILKAYRAALSLIEKCQQEETESKLLTCGPFLFQRGLCVACTFGLKVLRSEYAQLVDAEEGRKASNLGLLSDA
ncbi:uncharacterized protein A1O9_03840 [Exophiala aquamarina CBS 119918]|uniref:Uncharacterized protein n=1 Tax=Exophiala aquamarina CBS 119918 TaxID=1182545 RepID=A0A072PGV9_9EURO|nr:uncharacterized protein A1O9_03840 [Exophiala aquamarina CBS 119918]KEF58997.1 hypothetical protein A1O9_03840 [Exophiala aquamarina CBS 119918]